MREALTMLIENKSLLVTLFFIFYGAVSVPAYWIKDNSPAAFDALMALYVVYAVSTYTLTLLLNMYIPHCMRVVARKDSINLQSAVQTDSNKGTTLSNEVKTPIVEINTFLGEANLPNPTVPREYGFKMSIMGGISTPVGGILGLIVVIILSQTLPGTGGQTAGLLVTTVVGFITIAGSAVAYLGLPFVPSKPGKDWKTWWVELATPFKDLLQRKNMFVLLLSYTIYTDTIFALNSVTSQLYFVEVLPDTLEYSLYSLAGNVFQVVCGMGFYLLQIWRSPFSLERWLMLGYALILIIPVWGCIGLADNTNFGFKVAIPFTKWQLSLA